MGARNNFLAVIVVAGIHHNKAAFTIAICQHVHGLFNVIPVTNTEGKPVTIGEVHYQRHVSILRDTVSQSQAYRLNYS